MFKAKGYSKFLDLSGSIRLYYVIALGIFFAIFSFVLYSNIIVTFTMIVCTVISYYLLSISPKNITITIDEENIIIDDTIIDWNNCVEWALVDLHGVMEFVIRTNRTTKPFTYFYLDDEDPKTKKLITILSSYLPYNPETSGLNPVHSLLRNWGLR
ncbi:MAG: hypothetical protein AAGF07_01255 [Patescibacteria group bacterium]